MMDCMATVNQIAKAHTTARLETVADAVSRANRWSAALIEAGFETALKNEYSGFDGQAVIVGDNPTSESELCAIEESLGLALPPSYRDFLGDAGSLTFLNNWWDETTPSNSLADEAKTWRREVKSVHGHTPLVAARESLGLLRFSDYKNHMGEWIYLCDFRDSANEAPHFLWFHDDIFGEQADLDWVLSIEEQTAATRAARARQSAAGFALVETPLTRQLDGILACDESQRDKLIRVEAMQSAIERAEADELYTCLHGIRRAIKSKKLCEQRESLLVALRRDGEAADAKLPALDRQSLQSDAKAPGSFGTFDEWVAGVVDAIIEDVTAALNSDA